MPLTAPKKPEAAEELGELINWSQEWKTQAEANAVALFRIRERLADEDYGNGPVVRFSVDVLFVTGPRTGEVHTDVWVLGKGMTASLQREEVGAEVPYRLKLGQKGTTRYAQANEPTADDFAKVQAVYRELWWVPGADKIPAPAADDQPPF